MGVRIPPREGTLLGSGHLGHARSIFSIRQHSAMRPRASITVATCCYYDERSNRMVLTMLQRAARHWNSDSPDDWLLHAAHRHSAGRQHLDWLSYLYIISVNTEDFLWFWKSLLIIVTDRISKGGNAIASVRLSVCPSIVCSHHLRNRLTVDLELLHVRRSCPWLAGD